MNCSYCGQPIILTPSAAARARKCGGKPSDYISLFTMHVTCQLLKREKDTLVLMRKIRKGAK